VRDIPGFLLSYIVITVVCIVAGITVEAFPPFWTGLAFGIAIGMSVTMGLLLTLTRKGDASKLRGPSDKARTTPIDADSTSPPTA
jgi:hypothetical protein